jgi:arylsulfatase
VVIVADDMGFSDIGPYGSEIETPNLDRLAADGLRFTQFYNAARCCPTRAALLTGQYPHRTGIGHMLTDMGVPGYRGDLNSRCVTMAEVLRQSGYRTYMSGKWHLTKHVDQWTEKEQHTSKQNWPLQRGFDRFYGTITGAGSYYNPVTLTRGNTPVESVPEGYYYTDAISTQASQYVEDHARTHPGAPFFLYAAYTAPHWPLHAPSSAVDRYRGRYDEGWEPLRRQRYERMKAMGLLRDPWELSPPGRATEGWPASPVPLWNDLSPQARRWYRRAMEVYAAQVDIMDQGVGRIVDALERTGQLDNTLLLFFSDNGGCAELLREGWSGLFIPDETKEGQPVVHDNTRKDLLPGPPRTYMSYEAGWARASNTPFRLYKHWVHEGGIATPFIAHWPERFQGDGEMIRTPAHVVDLMATVVEVSGAAYPTRFQDHDIQPMQGKSLVPIFEGGSLAQRPLFWEHEGNRAVRRGRWKLVAEHDEEWRLHDLTIDRSELYDLSGQHPEKAQALATLYEAWAERTGVRSWPLAQ